MSMHRSVEAGCIESVVEGDLDAVRYRLRECMMDGELTEFGNQVSGLLDLVNEEIVRRGLDR